MKLIADAKLIFKKSWAVRFSVLGSVFGVAEMLLPYATLLVPPRLMLILAVVACAGAAISRIVRQPKMNAGRTRRRADTRLNYRPTEVEPWHD